MSLVPAVNDDSFDKEVLQSDQLVLVDFWAEWCGPCQMLSPILDAVAESLKGKVKILKMNVDKNPNTPVKYNIRSLPTLILFKDGKDIETKKTAMPKNKLEEWIQENA